MGKRKRIDVSTIIFSSILGCVFIALGIGVLIAVLSSLTRVDNVKTGFAAIVPILLLGILPIAMGCVPIVMTVRELNYARKEKKACQFGIENTAKIIGHKTVSYYGVVNRRFALKLSYIVGGTQKTFMTDYLYDINEMRYLQSRRHIQIKVHENFVAVTEEFPNDIYTINPKTEIETAFFKQRAVKITLRIYLILCAISIAFLILSMVLSTVLHNRVYLVTAALLFVGISFPFAIILLVFLIKWIRRKPK